MNDFESNEFIEKLIKMDPVSVELYVRNMTAVLFKKASNLGFSKEESEDIVQSTWITFFQVIGKFEKRSKLKTFIIGILYNKSSEFKKKNFRLKDAVNIDELIDQNFNEKNHWVKNPIEPDKMSMASQVLSIISKCLELLPIQQKIAFQMKEIEEEDTTEICSALNVSTSNLGVLLFRARNQLRECVQSKNEGGLHEKM